MKTQISLPETDEEKADIAANKDIAAFSYIWIMSLVVYFAKKKSPFVRFHSRQAIVLFLLSIPVSLLPILGRPLMVLILAGMVLGFLRAASGERRDVPMIGPLSRGELSPSDMFAVLRKSAMHFVQACRGILSRVKPSSTLPVDKSVPAPVPSKQPL